MTRLVAIKAPVVSTGHDTALRKAGHMEDAHTALDRPGYVPADVSGTLDASPSDREFAQRDLSLIKRDLTLIRRETADFRETLAALARRRNRLPSRTFLIVSRLVWAAVFALVFAFWAQLASLGERVLALIPRH